MRKSSSGRFRNQPLPRPGVGDEERGGFAVDWHDASRV